MRRKKREQGTPAAAGAKVTPADVQQVEFRLAFRGYNERDVDAFLDRVTEDLAWYVEENTRLHGLAAAPTASGPADDVASARLEAEKILAEARDKAAEIVRRAEREAGATTVAGARGGDPRAAVAPFLNMEREFLQGLGALVQTHAEEVKEMVLALRARTEQAREAEVPEAPPAPSQAETLERPDEPEPAEAEPVVVEVDGEPAYSSEGAPAGDGRERSLRELFWGED
jgi:DivIVA domain-containing protein